jgi:hypothetical protein
MEHKEFVSREHPNESFKGTIQIQVRFSGSARGQMGGQWHRTNKVIHISLWKGK